MIAPQHRIQENDSVVVDCVAGGPPNADVRIFKLNEDQDIEIKLRQGKGFASLQVPHFSKEHEGKYICETEVAHMRRRRKMTLNLIGRFYFSKMPMLLFSLLLQDVRG